jgi:hypothetical protein
VTESSHLNKLPPIWTGRDSSLTEIPLGQQLLQPCVLGLDLSQTLHIHRLELAESLAPGVDRHIADPVLLGDLGHRGLIGLTQDLYHLLFRKSGLFHGSSLSEKTIFRSFSWDANRLAGQIAAARAHRKMTNQQRFTMAA